MGPLLSRSSQGPGKLHACLISRLLGLGDVVFEGLGRYGPSILHILARGIGSLGFRVEGRGFRAMGL